MKKILMFFMASMVAGALVLTGCDNGTTGGGKAPKITTTSLPNGVVETAYSQTLAASGNKPIKWTLDSGALPAGLSLSKSGVVSGTPTTAGKSDFTVKATNSTGSSKKSFSITITTTGGEIGVGNNPVGGKTYYDSLNKIEFAASTGASGTYTGYIPRSDPELGDMYDEDEKFLWDVEETGTYTWNESAKTVTLEPKRHVVYGFGAEGQVLDRAGFRDAAMDYWNARIEDEIAELMEEEGITEEEAYARMQEMLENETGYTSMEQYIAQIVDDVVAEMFDNRRYAYSFVGDFLLMRQELPQPKGTDELAGKTYNGMMLDGETWEDVKDPDKEYVFGSGKTYVYKENGTEYMTGSYSYDSEKKIVYLSPVTRDGKTAAEYFEAVEGEALESHHFISDDVCRASLTNANFAHYWGSSYDADEKLIK